MVSIFSFPTFFSYSKQRFHKYWCSKYTCTFFFHFSQVSGSRNFGWQGRYIFNFFFLLQIYFPKQRGRHWIAENSWETMLVHLLLLGRYLYDGAFMGTWAPLGLGTGARATSMAWFESQPLAIWPQVWLPRLGHKMTESPQSLQLKHFEILDHLGPYLSLSGLGTSTHALGTVAVPCSGLSYCTSWQKACFLGTWSLTP